MNEEKLEQLKTKFNNLLLSTKRVGIPALIDYLETTDFYTAPASARYHYNETGGLLVHSLNVYYELKKQFNNVSPIDEETHNSLLIIGLLHDVCKIGKYKINERGIWKTIPSTLPIGHAEKSVIMIQKFISLTDDEIIAIRWHMGMFGVDKSNYTEYNDFNQAMDNKIVFLTHISDWVCSRIIETDIERNVDSLLSRGEE